MRAQEQFIDVSRKYHTVRLQLFGLLPWEERQRLRKLRDKYEGELSELRRIIERSTVTDSAGSKELSVAGQLLAEGSVSREVRGGE